MLMLLLAVGVTGAAQAHKPGDSYLALKVEADQARVSGEWDIALRDLEFAIDLDIDGDGNITADEVRAKHADIASYALARLAVLADGTPCTLRSPGHSIARHSDGEYAALKIQADCASPASAMQASTAGRIGTLDIRYKLFFDLDAGHEGVLLLVFGAGTATDTVGSVFAANRAHQRFGLRKRPLLEQVLADLRHGGWHIGIGVDHVLFLFALLLPAVLMHRDARQ